jgi:lipase ATG15
MTRPEKILRLADRRPSTVEPLLTSARLGTNLWAQSVDSWVVDEVLSPDVTDRDTVINFALMAANAYTLVPGTNDWEDLDEQFGFNTSLDFGWNSNGLRGHVYADEKNSTVIIGIKGTSRALYDGDETTTSDKENDNLYFSCCCAQQGQWTWRQVCNCATDTYSCNSTCLVKNLREDHRFYQAARYLYSNITEMYPKANVWVTGHSLGGSIASLLGLTYGLPTITFETPPEALPASRLGLPTPQGSSFVRSMTGVYHFGHTADPVFMGTCTGATATCSFYGYAFESQCHAGTMCTYDTVGDHGWRVGIWTHGIREVIKNVLRAYDKLPECIVDDECVDCFNWKFYKSNSSSTTTSSSSISTRTRTRIETCTSPGWWGCLDKTTSTTDVATTSTTTSTSTCKTPGWFWCKDKISTTSTSTTSSVAKAPSSNLAPSITHTTSEISHATSVTDGQLIRDSEL